jgi:hypothetical protein
LHQKCIDIVNWLGLGHQWPLASVVNLALLMWQCKSVRVEAQGMTGVQAGQAILPPIPKSVLTNAKCLPPYWQGCETLTLLLNGASATCWMCESRSGALLSCCSCVHESAVSCLLQCALRTGSVCLRDALLTMRNGVLRMVRMHAAPHIDEDMASMPTSDKSEDEQSMYLHMLAELPKMLVQNMERLLPAACRITRDLFAHHAAELSLQEALQRTPGFPHAVQLFPCTFTGGTPYGSKKLILGLEALSVKAAQLKQDMDRSAALSVCYPASRALDSSHATLFHEAIRHAQAWCLERQLMDAEQAECWATHVQSSKWVLGQLL